MKIKLKELLPIQEKVNLRVLEKLGREEPISNAEFILAFNVEFFEFINEVGIWKWWKHNHVINKERVLDELADLYAFFLSLFLSKTENTPIEDVEDFINNILNMFLEKESDTEALVKELILFVGTDNERDGMDASPTVERFSIAILITILMTGVTQDEIIEAYKNKSNINIKRQNENY